MKIGDMTVLFDSDFEFALNKMFLRLAKRLDLSNKVRKKYKETIAEDILLVKGGKRPSTVVAARIYLIGLSLNETRSQILIGRYADVSETTIRNMYKIMDKKKIGKYKLTRD